MMPTKRPSSSSTKISSSSSRCLRSSVSYVLLACTCFALGRNFRAYLFPSGLNGDMLMDGTNEEMVNRPVIREETKIQQQMTTVANDVIHSEVDNGEKERLPEDDAVDNMQSKVANSVPIFSTTRKTTITTSSGPSPLESMDPVELADLQHKFYQRHYDALHATPLNDMLMFDPVIGFLQFKRQFTYYQIMPDEKGKLVKLGGANQKGTSGDLEAFDIPKNPTKASRIVYFWGQNDLCRAALFFHRYRHEHPDTPWPHVLLVGLHRDFGALSSSLKGLTYQRNYRFKDWAKMGCTNDTVISYMNHSDTLGVITTQFHALSHPKAFSIPLGLQKTVSAKSALEKLHQHGLKKPRNKLVMVNFKMWIGRIRVLEFLTSHNFSWANGTNYPVVNTYVKSKGDKNLTDAYYEEIFTSKFVMSPRGWALDCYRHWEALFAGCIPVIEHFGRNTTDHWFQTFENLPVAFIDWYEHMTPEWFEAEYIRLISQWDTYHWDKLTMHYWVNFVNQLAYGGTEYATVEEGTVKQ